MQIKELDRKKNKIVIHVDSVDDFYYLMNFIRKGDIITAKTTRKIQVGGEEGEKVRVPMLLSISVEKVGFQEFADRLRIKGKIVDGPQHLVSLGSYHTLNITIGDTFELKRHTELTDADINYLKKIEELKKPPTLVLVAISDDEASIGVLTSIGLNVIGSFTNNIPAKHRTSGKEIESIQNAFFKRITDIIKEALDKYSSNIIVVAGPGFFKEHFAKFLKNAMKDVKIYVDDVSNSTVSGLHEIIKRGIPEKILSEHKIVEEEKAVEEVLMHIGKGDGMVAIGLEETHKAIEYGLAKKLMISASKLRELDGEQREKLIDLLRKAEKYNIEIMFISELHPSGEQFKRMGGIAAILRYKVDLK